MPDIYVIIINFRVWTGIARRLKPLEILEKDVGDTSKFKAYSVVVSDMKGSLHRLQYSPDYIR